MAFTTRILRSYDHRLRNLVRSAGDIGHATRRGIPRSTARGWLTSTRAEVVTLDVVDMDVLNRAIRIDILDVHARVLATISIYFPKFKLDLVSLVGRC